VQDNLPALGHGFSVCLIMETNPPAPPPDQAGVIPGDKIAQGCISVCPQADRQ